ncbi:MAG: cyclic lactone autoinducer peptide [Eubacterium sp.]
MQKFKSFLMKFGSTFAALALMVGIATSNSSCLMVFHQPKEPEAMNKFKF